MHDAPRNQADADGAGSNEADLELLGRIAIGDRAAFRQLYLKHYASLHRFIHRMTGRPDSAEEGVNDVMLVVWQSSGAFRGGSKVSTWLMGIAYRKALRLVEGRRRWVDRFKSLDPTAWNELSTAAEEPTEGTELEDWIEHGMEQLSAKQRAVVQLTYLHGYSYEEIAAITGCPVNTVKTRMFHARANLKRILPGLARGGRAE